jgi:hypothetical protein
MLRLDVHFRATVMEEKAACFSLSFANTASWMATQLFD